MSNLLNEIIETIDANCELCFSKTDTREDLRIQMQQWRGDRLRGKLYNIEAVIARVILFDSRDANLVASREIARLRELIRRN